MEFGEDMITHDCPLRWMYLRNNYKNISSSGLAPVRVLFIPQGRSITIFVFWRNIAAYLRDIHVCMCIDLLYRY